MHALFDEWMALAARLGRVCMTGGCVIAGAESCTGGLIAAAITSVGGSSAWFDGACVTYSNEAKQTLLGVSASTLATHGAVSVETAAEMALGALHRSGGRATLAYAVTGIAGPGGGSRDKPVGTVCFGFAQASAPSPQLVTRRLHLPGDRSAVREQSVNVVLRELLRRAEPHAR
ncbi:MAG: nicotinamide-nucleotide amidohydrolase family protein [Burkholderiales bacterium]|nr:nicotinamide-nucleotide amidohydrolase family protein [Burkholderiales bacterium]